MLQEIPCMLSHWYFEMHFITCCNTCSPKKGFLETCFFSTLSSSYCLSWGFCYKKPSFFIASPTRSCNPGHLQPTCCPPMNHSSAQASQDQTLPGSCYWKQTQTILEIQGRAASLHPCKLNSQTRVFHLKLMDNLSVTASVQATYAYRHLLPHTHVTNVSAVESPEPPSYQK